jgi:hypothetical protein
LARNDTVNAFNQVVLIIFLIIGISAINANDSAIIIKEVLFSITAGIRNQTNGRVMHEGIMPAAMILKLFPSHSSLLFLLNHSLQNGRYPVFFLSRNSMP